MTTRAFPLEDLAQRITQHQAELEKLREEYETRQTQFRTLTQRKEELHSQLQQVEAEIEAIGTGTAASSAKPAATTPVAAKTEPSKTELSKTEPSKTGPSKPGPKSAGTPTLAEMVVQIVTAADKPLTARLITEELVRIKYPTTSNNLSAMVEKRISDLVQRKLLRRAKNQPGVLPGQTQAAAKTAAMKAPEPDAASKPAMAAAPNAPAKATAVSVAGLTLPQAVERVLAASAKPLTAQELAKQVLAAGYQTKSKSFKDVIWSGVSKMENIENVSGQGYRLKKGKQAK